MFPRPPTNSRHVGSSVPLSCLVRPPYVVRPCIIRASLMSSPSTVLGSSVPPSSLVRLLYLPHPCPVRTYFVTHLPIVRASSQPCPCRYHAPVVLRRCMGLSRPCLVRALRLNLVWRACVQRPFFNRCLLFDISRENASTNECESCSGSGRLHVVPAAVNEGGKRGSEYGDGN